MTEQRGKTWDHRLVYMDGLHLSSCSARDCDSQWAYRAEHYMAGGEGRPPRLVRRKLCDRHARAWAAKHGLAFPPKESEA